MPNVNLAPYDPRQQAIDRRRALAAALQQQAYTPIQTPPVAGARINPLEGIAKIAQAISSQYQQRKLDKKQEALNAEIQSGREAQAEAFVRQLGLPTAEGGTDETRIKALARGLASPDPQTQQQHQFLLSNILASQRQAQEEASRMSLLQTELAARPTPQRNIDPLSPEGIAARIEFEKTQAGLQPPPAPRNIDPLSPEGIAARIDFEKNRPAPPAAAGRTPIPGTDFPLPPEVEAQRIRMSATRAQQGRPVVSGDAGRIADFDTSLDDLVELRTQIGASGATGTRAKIGAMLPNAITDLTGWGTDAKQKQAVIDRVKQVIGKALEGGVLRKEDEYKYEKILPTIADTSAVVKTKLDGLEAAITQRRVTTLDALEDAGYDVSRYRARGGATPAQPATGGWKIERID